LDGRKLNCPRARDWAGKAVVEPTEEAAWAGENAGPNMIIAPRMIPTIKRFAFVLLLSHFLHFLKDTAATEMMP
jgi:hypothetical protein